MAIKKTEDKKETTRIKCLGQCGKEKAANNQNFYENTNPLFSSDKLEVCKDCLKSFIGDRDDSKGYLERIQSVLSLMDKPFLEELWFQRDRDWAKYIPQLSSFTQYKGLTFKDSTLNINREIKEIISEKKNIEISEKYSEEEINGLISFWGKGIELEDLEYLQNEYEKLINSYECDSYAMELLFQEASQCRLTIKKMRLDNKSVDKELKTLQDLLGSANIKPVQETGANSAEQATFGTLIKKYENEKPIPEPDSRWADVDGIKKYMGIWFFGHLAKMLGVKNEQSEMYEQELNAYKVEAPEYQGDEEGA